MSDGALLGGGRREGGLRFGDLGEDQQGLVKAIQEALGGTQQQGSQQRGGISFTPRRGQGELDEATGLFVDTTNPDTVRFRNPNTGEELGDTQIKQIMRTLDPDKRQAFAQALDARSGGTGGNRYSSMIEDLEGSGGESLFLERPNEQPGEREGPQARIFKDDYGTSSLMVPGRRGNIQISTDDPRLTARSLARLEPDQLQSVISRFNINVPEGMSEQDKLNRVAEALAVKAGGTSRPPRR